MFWVFILRLVLVSGLFMNLVLTVNGLCLRQPVKLIFRQKLKLGHLLPILITCCSVSLLVIALYSLARNLFLEISLSCPIIPLMQLIWLKMQKKNLLRFPLSTGKIILMIFGYGLLLFLTVAAAFLIPYGIVMQMMIFLVERM